MRRALADRLLVTLVLLAPVPLAGGPAVAQADDQQAGEGTSGDEPDLLITGLTGVVRSGDRLDVTGEVRNPGGESLEGAHLVATLLRPSSNRLDLHRALDDPGRAPARRVVGRFQTDLQPVPAGGRAPLQFDVPITDLGLGALPDAAAGVYPLQLDLRQGGALLDQVVTSLIAMPDQLGEPLRAAIVAPLDSPLGLSADGSVVNDPLAGDLGGGGHLPGLADALQRAPDLPLTLATSGAVLTAAEEAIDGFTATDAAGAVVVSEEDPEARRAASLIDDVNGVLGRPEVEHVALPFASADLVALVRDRQPDAARQAMAQGAVSSAAATGDRPAPGVLLPPDHLDEATLDTLAAAVDTVLLDARNLGRQEPNPAGLTPSPVRRLPTSGGSTLSALVADAWLSALLAGDFPPENGEVSASTPALAAQRILAESAAVYFERPFNEQTRGLLLTPPIPWNLPADTLMALLEGLDEAPWLRPVTAPDLAEQVPMAEEPVALAYPEQARARELDAAYLASIEEARVAVASLAAILATDEEPEDADRVLRIATSIYYRGERRDQGLQLVDTVQAAANSVFDGVGVVPGPQFTLTSRSGDVPVTLANESGVAVRVFVRVESPRFAFAQDVREATLAPGEQVPVVFRTEALTPGATAPIEVTVTDAQEDRVLATGRVVVATRADSVTALVVTVGAGLFLAGWWLRDVRRRRTERLKAKMAS
ncbi:MAG: hypothetical protein GEU81_01470 [Nitriliruptorales bacterium]|nr:hypothetical protein [Nitriliruptorales bacterium]